MTTTGELLGAPSCAGCGTHAGPLCGRCRARLGPRPVAPAIGGVTRTLAPWPYEGAARALVLQLKLRGRRPAAAPLVEAMCHEVTLRGLSAQAVTWVPGPAAETRRRGFDHAEILARGVAHRLGLRPLRLLCRTGPRRDQAGLGARERRENLAGAFASRRFARPVVLVDDLVTTGATAEACASALLAAGVPQVEVLAPCRA